MTDAIVAGSGLGGGAWRRFFDLALPRFRLGWTSFRERLQAASAIGVVSIWAFAGRSIGSNESWVASCRSSAAGALGAISFQSVDRLQVPWTAGKWKLLNIHRLKAGRLAFATEIRRRVQLCLAQAIWPTA